MGASRNTYTNLGTGGQKSIFESNFLATPKLNIHITFLLLYSSPDTSVLFWPTKIMCTCWRFEKMAAKVSTKF